MGAEDSQSQPHEYYVDLLKHAPKVSPEEMTQQERTGRIQRFGENFFLLFEMRKRVEESADPEFRQNLNVQTYLVPMETLYPDKWQRFLTENSELIGRIDTALDTVRVYRELYSYLSFLRSERTDVSTQQAEELVRSGLNETGVYAWRQLNPLLEEAAGKLQVVGVNPEEFFS